MKKRIYAALLALCMILNMFSGIALAEGEAAAPVVPEGEAHAHIAGEQKVTKKATCTEEGVWEIRCATESCNILLETGAVEMLAHVEEEQRCENDHKDPTCTEDGYDWIHCTLCKNLIAENEEGVLVIVTEADCVIPALGHDWADEVPAKEATCEEKGHSAYIACERVVGKDEKTGEDILCGAYLKGHEKVETAPKGHGEAVIDPDYVLDCEEDKDDANSTDDAVPFVCSICGKTLHEAVTVPAPHTWKEWEVLDKDGEVIGKTIWHEGKAPTCTAAGYTEYRECAICGRIEGKEEIKATGHSYVYYGALAGSCTEDGRHAGYKCSKCGAIDPERPTYDIEAPGHDWGEVVAKKNPTCVETGMEAYQVCERCGAIRSVEVDEEGDIVDELGEGKIELEVVDHTWKMVPGVKATCTENGEGAHSVCTVCGAKQYVDPDVAIIPAHGHADEDGYYPEWAKYADTSLFKGEAGTVRKWQNDGVESYWYNEEEGYKVTVDKDGKEVKVWIVADATCTEDGFALTAYCSFCGEVRKAGGVLPKLGHDWGEAPVVAGKLPTCTETGLSDKWECSRCDAVLGGDVINERGHNMVKVAVVLPTCEKDKDGKFIGTGNYAYEYCDVCGYAVAKKQDVVEPKLNNEVVASLTADVVVDAVKDEEGNYVIPEVYEAFVIPAYAHRYTEEIAAVAPTCTENGIKEGATRCRYCGEMFNVELLKALGHVGAMKQYEAVEATCTEDGLKAYVHCERCDKAVAGTVDLQDEKSVAAMEKLLNDSTIVVAKDEKTEEYITPAEFIIKALGHDVKKGIALAPTCTEKGHTDGEYCGRCLITLKGYEEIPALGHDMSKATEIVYVAPTCTKDGTWALMQCVRCDVKAYDCECDDPKTEAVEACTCKGIIPATGHDAGAYTPIKAATCTEYGYTEGAHCTKCEIDYEPVLDYLLKTGYVAVEDLYEAGWLVVPQLLAPLGHDMVAVEGFDADCDDEGLEDYVYCKNCAHAVKGGIVAKVEDEKAEGYEEYTEWYNSITNSTVVKPADTKDKDGKVVVNHPAEFVIKALGHTTITVGGTAFAPTCTEAGSNGLVQCVVCKAIYNKAVPALGHDWVKVDAVKATCAAAGNIAYEDCSRCDALRVANGTTDEKGNFIPDGTYSDTTKEAVVDPKHTTHDNLQHKEAIMATCTTDGRSAGQYCDVCGYNDFTVIKADAAAYHEYLEANMEALLKDGTLTWTVTNAGNGKPGSGMQAVLCPDCGHIVDVKLYPEVLAGDVNMDGKVNSLDALMILQYKAGVIETLPNKVAADYNLDGVINSKDALGILNSKIN